MTYSDSEDKPYPKQYDDEPPTGLFSTPGRAFALGGSLVALLVVLSALVFMLGARNTPPVEGTGSIENTSPAGMPSVQSKVPVVSNVSQTGSVTKGSIPPNFEWTDARTGQKMSLTDLRGKAVWLNFWGTWCPPCRAEMPEMQKVYNKHKDDLTIIGISLGPRDTPGLVLDYLNQFHYNWDFVQDDSQELGVKYQAFNIPMSYFIGPDGTIKAVSIGGIQANAMEGYIAQAR